MNDEEKLELITEAFTKALIANKFDNVKMYVTLAFRLAALMDAEILWQMKWDKDQDLMGFWPKEMMQ